MANKPGTKRKEEKRTHGGKEEEKREKQTQNTFSTNKNRKNRQLAQPGQTLTQGGHEIASLLN